MSDVFDEIKGKRMSELSEFQTDIAYEMWLRDNIGWFEDYHRVQIEALLRIIDRLRGA